ncbi:MAG: glycosyltransferase family 2 protein, partial [Candidatus Moranbacteria bacterium]|nr:glycosyltransferase family 2 protein [Candidatus Moranbacteria bacterium]
MENEISANKKIFIVIPAYNEEKVIADVVLDIQNHGYENIIIVDDGSQDNTYEKVRSIDGVVALKHKINRGKGAATTTGIEAAKVLGAEIIVLMDGDGQHKSADIEKLITPIIEKETEIVLGCRPKEKNKMPLTRIVFNHIGNAVTWFLCGLSVKDSQSGFRAFSRNAVEIIKTKADRYEYESDVIRQIYKNKLS